MKKIVLFLGISCLLTTEVSMNAQNTPSFTTQQDHQNMLDQLSIKSLRPGPSGNEQAPNHANYEESLANPCPLLPDALMLSNGKKVKTAKQWWEQRRPEIVADFEHEIYGKLPASIPGVSWSIIRTERYTVGRTPVLVRQLVGHVDNSSFPPVQVDIKMVLVLPTNVKGKVPVLMMFGWPRFPAMAPEGKPAPTDLFLEMGWGYATLDPGSIQADNGAGLTKGIIGLVNKGEPRKPDDWGALRAWSWGAARALDYLETDALVDAKKVGIEGVSRYGKAALVTLAFEPRFAIGLIGSSGKGGTTLLRRTFGEAVESLAGSGEYHWMAGNFLKYAETDGKTGCDLPVDSHELLALCAPKPTFISYGIPEKGDANWLDQKGSYMATIASGSVYKLLGVKDLGVSNDYLTEQMPPHLTDMLDGKLAWRQHDGGHTDIPNFPYFIPWANKQLKYKIKPLTN